MRSIRDYLTADLECDSLLECVNGLHELDRAIYFHLLETDGWNTVEEIATAVEKERSTAYRAIRRLHDAGFVHKEQVTYETGGYCYRYEPVDPETIATQMSVTIDEWHEQLDGLVDEFSSKYGQDEPQPDSDLPSDSENSRETGPEPKNVRF